MTSNELDALKSKYPSFKVISSPLANCSVCHGTGEYVSKHDQEKRPCLCICLGDIDDGIRQICVDGLQNTIKKLQQELKEEQS